MQLAEESEFVEDEYSFSLAVNRPKESKLSANCLLSNKGNVKDCDRKSFLFNEISKITCKFLNLENRDSNKCKKNLLSNKIVKNNNIDSDSDSDSVIEIRVNFTRRASIRKRVFFHQRKLSSHIILADIFN